MNWDMSEGKWTQFKGKARQKWGKLTDDDFEQSRGRREELVGRIQQRYGHKKDAIERDIDQMVESL